jgi:hypothetical protein
MYMLVLSDRDHTMGIVNGESYEESLLDTDPVFGYTGGDASWHCNHHNH